MLEIVVLQDFGCLIATDEVLTVPAGDNYLSIFGPPFRKGPVNAFILFRSSMDISSDFHQKPFSQWQVLRWRVQLPNSQSQRGLQRLTPYTKRDKPTPHAMRICGNGCDPILDPPTLQYEIAGGLRRDPFRSLPCDSAMIDGGDATDICTLCIPIS